ncbi:MAG: putative toxin-antitoxin system toxin component, PIN family [Candidatus Aenigmarchaeota archaeon]|nr:putative toxin-antitoxin system toxin component, PIN family [Candidatus Aenigmarchaeota archaeon]
MKEEKEKLKVVLDTNIYVSSVFWLGKPHQIVELAIDGKIQVFTSPQILEELERVLKRDFVEEHDFIESQIALILEYSKVVRPLNTIKAVQEDPDDNKIVECAVTAQADYIITGDPHLLNLKEFHRTKIVKAAEFLSPV